MKKSTLSVLGGLIVGLILIITWFTSIDVHYLIRSISNMRLLCVLIAGIFYISAYAIRSYRWNLLLRGQLRLSFKESWLISAAGNWINYLIPIRAGEIIKAILIKRIKKRSAVSILPSIFIDKFFDTIGIFFVLLLIPFVSLQMSVGIKWLIVLLIFMFSIIFLILLIAAKNKGKITGILQVFFFWLPSKIRFKINSLIEIFVNGLNVFDHSYVIILWSVLLTALGVLLDGLYFFYIFKAFNYNIGFLIVLFGYTLINLSYVLPQPPAQLGSNEWMMIIVFSLGFGLTQNIASAIMVFAHIFTAFIITGFGIIGFSYAGIKSVRQVQKEL